MRPRDLLPARDALATFALLAGLVVAVALLATAFGSVQLQHTTIEYVVLLTAVVGFYVFVGNSGVLSFGHVCFMIVGAYVAALASWAPADKRIALFELPGWIASVHVAPYVACLLGGLVAAAVAVLIAVPLMRLSGIAAALTSFAFLQIVYVVVSSWDQVTNGAAGLTGFPTATTVGSALATAVAVIAVALAFQRTRWGARLRASREDEVAARAVGIGVHFERRAAFVLSAFVMGLSGGLYAQYLGTITPDTLYLGTTFLIVVMLISGGQRSLSGAIVGSLFVAVVIEVLRRIEAGAHVGPVYLDGPLGVQEVGLALILLVTLILRPAGLTGGRELTLPRSRRRRSVERAAAQPPAADDEVLPVASIAGDADA